MAWTTTDFLSDVKLKGFLPDTSNVTDAEILRVADGEVRTKIVPLVVGAEQEFWIDVHSVSLTAALTSIRIPTQALLGRVRDVTLTDSSGLESDPIPNVPIERFGSYSRNQNQTWFYMVRGDRIVLPTVTSVPSGWTVNVYYYRRPSAMCLSSAAMVTTAVNSGTYVLTGTPVAGWTTSTKLDVIQALPNFDVLSVDVAAAAVGGGSITLAADTYPTDVLAGDWVAVTGTTPIVPVPDLCYELLVSATTYQILKMTGFYEQASMEREELSRSMANVVQTIAPRVKSPSQKVINRYGPLRKGWY